MKTYRLVRGHAKRTSDQEELFCVFEDGIPGCLITARSKGECLVAIRLMAGESYHVVGGEA